MDGKQQNSGIIAERLSAFDTDRNFQDLHRPLNSHEAAVEADRCYFCHDAPCMTACPTSIDIPMFIRQISTGNDLGSAKTIFDQNIFGGMCARVCPTETLCEQVCVRQTAEGKPVKIGNLQRYATDVAMKAGKQFYGRASSTGKSVAVVGAGPAGLSCAHRLAMHGHDITVYEARRKPGGLNEFGIAAYKSVNNFAQAEIEYVTAVGGIAVESGKALGRELSFAMLAGQFDAVFLAIGLAGVNALEDGDTEAAGSEDAVEWIANLRQTAHKNEIPVGQRVVVIGGGMTAIDAAVQAKCLGADEVTLAYRGPLERMKASAYEQELAKIRGVTIRCNMSPRKIMSADGHVTGVEFERYGKRVIIEADQVMKAIGQTLEVSQLNGARAESDHIGSPLEGHKGGLSAAAPAETFGFSQTVVSANRPELLHVNGIRSGSSLKLVDGRIETDLDGKTSLANVWAGGDCTNRGDDLTVTAVAQGRDAAMSINDYLINGEA